MSSLKEITIPLENGTITVKLPTPTTYIYRFLSPNGKSYIGQSKDIPRRIQEHITGVGSKPLLKDLVVYGMNAFNISVLDVLYDDNQETANQREDHFIETLDCIHPAGYNLRLNRDIVPEETTINLNSIKIIAKYTFTGKDGFIYFSVPEFTQLRSYQILMNLGEKKGLAKKRLGTFNYFELKSSRTADLVPDCDLSQSQIYHLTLRYSRGFHIIDCS